MSTATKVPAIPAPDRDQLRAVKALKEIAEVREGLRGDPLDRFVTVRELESLIVNNEDIVARLQTAHTHVHATLTDKSADDHTQYLLADGTREASEIRLEPKVASTGPEGTIFYNSADDHVYVGTE